MKRLIIDLDGTITLGDTPDYQAVLPNLKLINKLREYKDDGFAIVIATARNMRTFKGNIGEINIHTLPTIIKWLDKHNVPYDEVLVGKPWCGYEGFYVDDKAIRPSEFLSLSHKEVMSLLERENRYNDSGNEI